MSEYSSGIVSALIAAGRVMPALISPSYPGVLVDRALQTGRPPGAAGL